MGKGSKRRPISVQLANFKANWDRVFKQLITKKETMLVLYTEKQLEEAYKEFLEDYEGATVPDLETFRTIYETKLEESEMDYSGAFESDIESCGGIPAGFIPKDTSIH